MLQPSDRRRRHRAGAAAFLATAFLVTTRLGAQAPSLPCTDAAHRALDFWIGRWVVFDTASNTPIAQSQVEAMFGGCSLKETYDQTVGPGGRVSTYHGSSYTAFNTGDRTWRQFYVDNAGAAFSYSGDIKDGAVVFTARAANQGTRMTLRPDREGTVRQIGEITKDGGTTWSPNFDFTYRRP